MEREYDKITAHYYSMYRPPLHHLILARCLGVDNKYELGLDIGCGTGNSSIALSEFCKQVIGIDPSKAMIENAKDHPKVQYELSDEGVLNFDDNSFDLLTFAGSLYYAKSQQILNETIRVCKDRTKIVVYDFNLDLNAFLNALFEKPSNPPEQTYNHKADFSGLINHKIQKLTNKQERLEININLGNIVKLLLSIKEHYVLLGERYGYEQLENKVLGKLLELGNESQNKIEVIIYYATYIVQK